MKNKKLIIRSLRSGLFGLAAAMSLIACTDEEVTYKVGQLPDEEAMTTVTGVLRSSKSLRDRVPVHLKAMKMSCLTKFIINSLRRHRRP